MIQLSASEGQLRRMWIRKKPEKKKNIRNMEEKAALIHVICYVRSKCSISLLQYVQLIFTVRRFKM